MARMKKQNAHLRRRLLPLRPVQYGPDGLKLSVADALPPRYFHASHSLHQARLRGADMDGKLLAYIRRCARRATRAFLDGIKALLDNSVYGGGARRVRTKQLYLEFFRTNAAGAADRIDRMIETAIGEWGVEHLDLVVLRTAPPRHGIPPPPPYAFPDHLLDDDRHRSRLRTLTLGHCAPHLPPLHRYTALETLVLQDTALEISAYAAVFHACHRGAPRLRVVHLLCCRGGDGDELVIDAACSVVEELVVDGCSFRSIELIDLPELRCFACLGEDSVELRYGHLPRLTHVNLTLSSSSKSTTTTTPRPLDSLLGGAPPSMSRLAVRFTGPERWILPRPLDTALLALKELLVADVPSTWDVSWSRLLLEAAPALEALHIHVVAADDARSKDEHVRAVEGHAIQWEPRKKFRHHRLREVYMVGFRNAPCQTRFLRYLVRVSKPLRRVVLVGDARVEGEGFWGWKTVEPRMSVEVGGSDVRQSADQVWERMVQASR